LFPCRHISAGRGHPLWVWGHMPLPAWHGYGSCPAMPCMHVVFVSPAHICQSNEPVEGYCISDVFCCPMRCRQACITVRRFSHLAGTVLVFSPLHFHHTLWSGKGGIEMPVIMLADCGDKMLHRHYDHGSPTLIPNNSKSQGRAIRWHGSAHKDVGTCFIGHAVHLMSRSPVYHTSLPLFCQILNF